MKKTPESFIRFVQRMYSENAFERIDEGQKPFPTVKAYLRRYRAWLESEYKKQKNSWKRMYAFVIIVYRQWEVNLKSEEIRLWYLHTT